jgi:DNA-binding GntR family transcriptional regulator
MDFDLAPVETTTLKESVYNKLLNSITSGKLPPGTQVTIAQLSALVGVSLMPVREALQKLAAGNFISVQKNRRIAINQLSKKDLNELRRIREKLECMAAREALKNWTPELLEDLERIGHEIDGCRDPDQFLEKNREFHHTLYRNAKMPILQETIEHLWWRFSPYLHIYAAEVPDYKSLAIENHEGVLRGVREKNAKEVCKWLTLDLKTAVEFVTAALQAREKGQNA